MVQVEHPASIAQLSTLYNQIQQNVDQLAPIMAKTLWEQSAPNLVSARSAFSDFFYQDSQDGRHTVQSCSVAVMPNSHIELLTATNRLKSEFKSCVSQLRKEEPKALSQWQNSAFSQRTEHRKSLRHQQLSRLNLKQVWRTLRIIDQEVQAISFNWYRSGRSIKKTDKTQVLKQLLLLEQEGRNIQAAWRTMANITDQQPLCIVQAQAPLIRANITFKDGSRQAFNSSVPIFLTAQTTLPSIGKLKPISDLKPRKTRADSKIETTPLIASLRLHRYLG